MTVNAFQRILLALNNQLLSMPVGTRKINVCAVNSDSKQKVIFFWQQICFLYYLLSGFKMNEWLSNYYAYTTTKAFTASLRSPSIDESAICVLLYPCERTPVKITPHDIMNN